MPILLIRNDIPYGRDTLGKTNLLIKPGIIYIHTVEVSQTKSQDSEGMDFDIGGLASPEGRECEALVV